LDLNDNLGFEVNDDVELTFPADLSIQPGEYIVYVKDVTEERWNGVSFQVFELASGIPGNSGDTVKLVSTSCGSPEVNDIVEYDNYTPWPEDGIDVYDEKLHSIELIHPDLDNNDAANWAGSTVEGVTPGTENSVYTP